MPLSNEMIHQRLALGMCQVEAEISEIPRQKTPLQLKLEALSLELKQRLKDAAACEQSPEEFRRRLCELVPLFDHVWSYHDALLEETGLVFARVIPEEGEVLSDFVLATPEVFFTQSGDIKASADLAIVLRGLSDGIVLEFPETGFMGKITTDWIPVQGVPVLEDSEKSDEENEDLEFAY